MSQAMSNSVKIWLIVVKYLAEINDYFVKMSSSYKTPALSQQILRIS